MKHIAIIPNYSGITEMVKGGEIAPNFLVKSENDQKVHFSNAAGYQVMVSGGDTYNMYINMSNFLEADIPNDGDGNFNFVVMGPNGLITADFDIMAVAYCNGEQTTDELHEYSVTNFSYSFGHDAGAAIIYYADQNLVQLNTTYYSTPEEDCLCAGGTWQGDECVIPTCEDEGLCGAYPDCYPCEEPGDPCGGDPECECYQQGPDWSWNGEECVYTEPV